MIRMKPGADQLNPYFVNDAPYKVKLDANECSGYMLREEAIAAGIPLNLYPDSDSRELRAAMARYYGCKPHNIIAGNGSGELISMVVNAYCQPGDRVVGFEPSFSMYESYSSLCGARYVTVAAEDDFSQDVDKLIYTALKTEARVVILCTPNNPTGYVTPREDIRRLLDNLREPVVIVDEAYADFCGETSVDLIGRYDNILVTRTMSKAFGLAGLRVGCMIGPRELTGYIWRVKPPYNINILSQSLAVKALGEADLVRLYTRELARRRDALCSELKDTGFRVWPSGGNFIFVEPPVDKLYEKLMACGILIRKITVRGKVYCRITTGIEEENKALITQIRQICLKEVKR